MMSWLLPFSREDQDAFRDLVIRYQGRVVNYLYRIVRNLEEAHDLAQEIFLRVYRALDRFDPSYKFSTWLFRVAQNAAIDRIRKRKIDVVSMHRADTGESDGGDWEFPSPDADPLRRFSQSGAR